MEHRGAVRIGVVTPVLNGEEFLRQTLDSIWTQVSDDVEIDHVLVDGGSTDRTMEIAADFPTRVLRSEDDQGMYDAVNKGLAEVNGAIVGYINADDEIAPGAVAAIVDAFRREPRAGWLCGKVEYIAPGGEVLGRMQPVRVSLASYAGIGWSTIPQQTVWARREFFDAIGPFDLAFRNCGDYDWYARPHAPAPADPESDPGPVPPAPGAESPGPLDDGAREPDGAGALRRHRSRALAAGASR